MNNEKVKIVVAGSVIVLILIVMSFFVGKSRQKSSDEVELQKSRQNLSALIESVEIYKNKNGQLVFEKSSLCLELEELKMVNSELSKQILSSKNKVLSMSEVILTYEKNYSALLDKYQNDIQIVKTSSNNDTNCYSISSILGDSTNGIRWQVSNTTDVIVCDTNKLLFVGNKIQNFKFGIKLFSGLEYDNSKKLYKVTASCPDSSAKIDIDGWINPETFYPKEKKWSLGFQIGIGAGMNKDIKLNFPQIYLGIGISRNLFSF